jgi:beta-lactamase regulating signal transducer with metallopeptidase domain
MKEILLTSSALILALLALRRVFRKTISRRAQYALWGLVLVRLLVPVSLPAAGFSLLTAAEPVGQAVTARLDRQEIYVPTGREPLAAHPEAPDLTPSLAMPPSSSQVWVVEDDETAVQYQKLTTADLLRWVWYAGMAVMAVCFLISNLRFRRMLCKARKPYKIDDCKYPVYLVERGLPSPCLFGLVRPAIYLTPAAAASPEILRHVLAHESTHAKHLDPLWSLLRCVCLAVYWFNPLVWAAAAASKADGELACDEGAIRWLGEGERISYGKTLLSLIPVRKGPVNPLLSATTMTADKRHLKDRITRIAENRQTRAAALFLVLAIAAGVCAVTFTGGSPAEEPRPLTGEELAYFNEEYFNGEEYNIRNQFLTVLYAEPENIDLFSLFYNGTGLPETMSDDEWRQVGTFDENGDLVCDCVKNSTANINQILTTYTGLTLEQTNRVDLDSFDYLPEYDAYYSSHGDTNARGQILFTAGEREGDIIRLYYQDFYFGRYGYYCVTLQEQADGSYWFVSHVLSEPPAIPTVYPEGEPALTIPLTGLAPYSPEPADVTRHVSDCAERYGGYMADDNTTFRIYRSTDGSLYAAVEYETAAGNGVMTVWDVGCFFTFPADTDPDRISCSFFSGLFGRSGVTISYPGKISENHYNTIYDYYYVDDSGAPVLLARAYGEPKIIDLDGDGNTELCASAGSTAQLFFQRQGQLYEADVAALVSGAWPEADYPEFSWWDLSRRGCSLWASVPVPGYENDPTVHRVSAFRTLYFDGDSLLLYKDTTTCTDHVADGIEAPNAVLEAARTQVLEALDWWQHHTGAQSYVDGAWQDSGPQAEWDDWRITHLELTDTAPAYPQLGLRIYGLGYELHSPTPERVQAAGGMYVDEDGWVGGFYVETPYLVFHTLRNSGFTLLENHIPSDVGGSSENPMFAAAVAEAALENGLLLPSEVRDVDLYYLFYANQTTFLNLLGESAPSEQETALNTLAAYAASGGAGEDADLFASGLQNLEWNSSALTEAGRSAYARLLAAVERQNAVSADEALALFTANPVRFLHRLSALPTAEQEPIARALAAYYAGGTSAQRARFSDALHSVTQPGLGAEATAVYELIRTACPLPAPAARTDADDAALLEAVRQSLEGRRGKPGITSLEILHVAVDEAETARVVNMYTASLSANAYGWSDDYTAKMAAVQAVWEAEYDFDALESYTDQENGTSACYFYLLPNQTTGVWEIFDSMGCAVPEEFVRRTFTKADAEFSGQALEAAADDMGYEERLQWVQSGGGELFPGTGYQLSVTNWQEAGGCLAWGGILQGTPHTDQNYLYLRFADGTLAQLPLCRTNGGISTAAPDTMAFSNGQLVYTIVFSQEEIVDGNYLIHLAGTYRYAADLAAKTVSLTIL